MIMGTRLQGQVAWISGAASGMGESTARLFAPRTTIRSKLHWSAGANVRSGIAYGPAFGIDGSTVVVERPDGTRVREHLDVGENPPVGAIVWYWLAQEAKDGVTLTFRDSSGRKIATLSSTDKDAPPARKPMDLKRLEEWMEIRKRLEQQKKDEDED